jgi:hypothetical protein
MNVFPAGQALGTVLCTTPPIGATRRTRSRIAVAKGEVRAIDQVDAKVADPKSSDSGSDGYSTLPFQFHTICLSVSAIHASQLVDGTGFEEESFSEAGLACIHMGQNAQIHNAHI